MKWIERPLCLRAEAAPDTGSGNIPAFASFE